MTSHTIDETQFISGPRRLTSGPRRLLITALYCCTDVTHKPNLVIWTDFTASISPVADHSDNDLATYGSYQSSLSWCWGADPLVLDFQVSGLECCKKRISTASKLQTTPSFNHYSSITTMKLILFLLSVVVVPQRGHASAGNERRSTPNRTSTTILTPDFVKSVQGIVDAEGIPGLTLAFINKTGPVEVGAWGVKSENGTKMTTDVR